MKTYIVETKQGVIKSAGWLAALECARELTKADGDLVVTIYVARAGEKDARVVGEALNGTLRLIPNGLLVPYRKLVGRRG